MSYNVVMKERYRLVFRGEVLEGQHAAVVKKRLGQTLKLTDDKLEELFSGKIVIISKNANAETTGKLQGAFKKAGAKLRALRIEENTGEPTQTPEAEPTQPPAPAEPAEESDPIDLLPVGSDILTADERPEAPTADIDTEHLELGEAASSASDASNEPPPPDVSHISVADAGEDLSDAQAEEVVEIEVDFDIAELGSMVGDPQPEPEPVVDIDKVDFDVAEPGANIAEEQAAKPVASPDTAHIKLERE